MNLLPNATDGLYAAVVAGIFGLLSQIRGRRSEKPARKDAWQKQAEALRRELDTAHQRELARLDGRIAAQDAEITRLNQLLSGQRGAGDD